MVMPSVGRRNKRSRASAAEVLTLALPMVSKVLLIAGIGPPGRCGCASHRSSNSLQPPQDGTSPTPISTRPM